jgi:hypothetical protein
VHHDRGLYAPSDGANSGAQGFNPHVSKDLDAGAGQLVAEFETDHLVQPGPAGQAQGGGIGFGR